MTRHVLRFHASQDARLRLCGDNIDMHQRRVMALCQDMAAAIGLPLHQSQLLDYARHHDEAEAVLGDIPGPAKERFPDLAAIYAKCEAVVLAEMGLGPWRLTGREKLLFQACDKLDAIMTAQKQGVTGDEWPGEIGKMKRRAADLGALAADWLDRKLRERA